ncbi:hypothetical protein [Microbacterium sp. KNMS]
MTHVVTITDPLPGSRQGQPVFFSVPGTHPEPLREARIDTGERVLCQRVGSANGETQYVAVVSFTGAVRLTIGDPVEDAAGRGIVELPAREADAHVRLDTGWFDLELCRGTALGTGASKWGLRHFAGPDGIDLLPSGNNAIGGFYGPFFTPENGLINPPEHTVAEIETVARGPVMHHYRLSGVVPDGLLDELRGKAFRIDWRFFHGAPFFERVYDVDPFRTVINGRSVVDKITVGDEFEGGRGELVFDRFAAAHGTVYRAGDPYAEELAKLVEATIGDAPEGTEKFEQFRRQLVDGMESAHWDLYWRLFCTWEGALSDEEIRERLAQVRAASHVRADEPERAWHVAAETVDVSMEEDATIFAGPADKTAEFHSEHGRAMVWWTSAPSGAFQIVQRRPSGWVNWGTNGENECPELPVGVVIRTAYGPFADRWMQVADGLETVPTVDVADVTP